MRHFAPLLVVSTAIALALACSPAEPPAPTPDSASLRRPAAGPVVGAAGLYGHHEWLGIPFAQAPVGDLRWRAPQPVPAWDEPRETLAFGAACPQFANRLDGEPPAEPGTPVGDEDCLTLNVYAPAFDPEQVPGEGERLPVMFWIHGGGNTVGTASFFNGGNLAQSQDVVVVTTNYRLGAFGWFRHPALVRDASPAESSGNFAVLDLIEGLTWVRENIAAFGGDPDNVTVFGESAGARNTAVLLASPLAEGLFHRAIVQSGSTRSVSLSDASNLTTYPSPGHENSAQEVVLRLLISEGVAPERLEAFNYEQAKSATTLPEELRAIPAETVLSAYTGAAFGMYDVPHPIQDGFVLPERPIDEVWRDGDIHSVPIMIGTTRDEEKVFMALDPEYTKFWFGLIPQVLDEERYQTVAEYKSLAWKVDGVDELAMALARSGRDDVFAYRFDWDEEPSLLWIDLGEIVGAGHGLEIPFVFNHFEMGPDNRYLYDDDNLAGRLALSDAMMSYWTRFAYTGDPGRGRKGELPAWTAWSAEPGGDTFVVLDTPAGGGPRMSNEFLTRERLREQFAADPRLTDVAVRCDILAQVIPEKRSSFDDSSWSETGCDALPHVAAD
jgi:para-nitrobenzyl esterase